MLSKKLKVLDSEYLARRLVVRDNSLVDFYSNDYLGLAQVVEVSNGDSIGSSGSRVVSGNHAIHEELETFLAGFHRAERSLLFNSAYVANIGLLTSLVSRHDTIIYDALCHASIRDGIRLSGAQSYHFRHNDIMDLEQKLKFAQGNILVVVEALYSMDGDCAPLENILEVIRPYGAEMIVDEAHSTAIYGDDGAGLVVAKGLHNDICARVHGFGKGVGSFGGCVVGSEVLINWLINKARSFIYTTSLPPYQVSSILGNYRRVKMANELRTKLFSNINYLYKALAGMARLEVIGSVESPIMGVRCRSNQHALSVSEKLAREGFQVAAIRSPTVPVGSERIKIVVHSFNTNDQMDQLADILQRSFLSA
jgi:8-amino-7-oxononanoate synthase